MTTPASDFDAAKAIAEQLKGMDKERQQRVLRWVAESLHLEGGLAPPAAHQPAAKEERGEAPAHDRGAALNERRPMDIKTFVESKRPKSDVQFATVVAYYYQFEAPAQQRRDAIDAKTLQDAARLAGRRRPPKPLMTLNNAKNLGYMDAPERGQFRINTVGENLVAMTLPGDEAGSGKEPPRKRAERKTKTRES